MATEPDEYAPCLLRLARLPGDPPHLAAALRRVRGGVPGARPLAPRGVHARPRARGALPARRESDRVGRARRPLALPSLQGRLTDHWRGRRRHAGHARRAARRVDQAQDVPGALDRAHAVDRAREAKRLMIPLEEIRRARERLGDAVLRTPLVRLDDRIWLKLENLQPIGSFKLRGALAGIRAGAPPGPAAGGGTT